MKIGLIRITGILSGSAEKKGKHMLTCTNVCTFLETSSLIILTSELVAGFLIYLFFSIQAAMQKIEYGDSKIDC